MSCCRNHANELGSVNELLDEEEDKEPKLPILYSAQYNVRFCGLEKLHAFDAAKGNTILNALTNAKFITHNNYFRPREITKDELRVVHTKRYLRSLNFSLNAAKIAEIPVLIFVPNYFVQRGYLKPMRFQTAGSIQAAQLALREGWSINLGGGFHHCSSDDGGGFCPYADITLAIHSVMDHEEGVENVMIIDLDAHQGNGHERDFIDNRNVYIIDMYNRQIYPKDQEAKLAIKQAVELKSYTEDAEYLNKLHKVLKKSFDEFKPNLIVYNAGTDILEGDSLGHLAISAEGVIKRDEIVFDNAKIRNIPIVMLLSGGYTRQSPHVITNSILNLRDKGFLKIRT